MSKKVLTAEERLKKHGKSIKGVGIFYLVCIVIIMFVQFSTLLNPVNLIIYGVQIAILVAMITGISKKQKYGITAAWIFEGYMIIATILSLVLGQGGPDLIGLIVMIWLPSDINAFSKALKEVNNNISNQDSI